MGRIPGADKTYTTSFSFPDIETDNPELERLWAMSQIEEIEVSRMVGSLSPSEADQAIEDLGVAYQLVTDETSMVVLSDAVFAERGIDRANERRITTERQAQAARRSQPVRNHRVDRQQPMFNHPAPRPRGGGGGAIDPMTGLVAIGLAGLAAARRRRNGRTVPPEKSRS